MNQQLEIEYKNLLTEEEYDRLIQHFNVKEKDYIHQINYYFDTPDFQLKEAQIGLRIRQFENSGEFTLKVPEKQHLLEYNVPIKNNFSEEDIKSNHFIWPEQINDVMISHEIDINELSYLFSLRTQRFEKEIQRALVVLDKSFYQHHIDYELEVEGPDEATAQAVFSKLIEDFNLPQRPVKNKVQRAFEAYFN